MPISSADTSQAPPAPAATAALGNITKSSSPPLPDDLPAIRAMRARAVIRERRATRYELQTTAREILMAAGRRERLAHPWNYHRTAKCLFASRRGGAEVLVDREHQSAFYRGLMACGSVWTCPVCAAKIEERRRQEITQAFAWAERQLLQPVMITLTFPHQAWDRLPDLLERQAQAFRLLRSGKAWQGFKQRTGFRGLIRSLELTHGDNGWHPHTHEVWFVNRHTTPEAMREFVLDRWEAICKKVGLLDESKVPYFREHAVDVKGGIEDGDYLAKMDSQDAWEISHEMAKASSKKGREKGGLHPFGLLRLAAEGGDAGERAARLFLDYTAAVKGRRRLYWSAGLRELVGVDDLSDEEVAEEARETADILGQLTQDEWVAVRRAGLRAELLDAAETGGWAAVEALVAALAATGPGAPPPGAASVSGAAAAGAARPWIGPHLALHAPPPADLSPAADQLALFEPPPRRCASGP